MSGSCSASWASAARSAARLLGSLGEDHSLKRRAREARSLRHSPAAARRSRRRPGRCRGPDRRHLPRLDALARGAPAGAKTRIAVAFARRRHPPARAARPERAGEQPRERDPLARGRPLDLEHPARTGASGSPRAPDRSSVDAGEQLLDARRRARPTRRRPGDPGPGASAPRAFGGAAGRPGAASSWTTRGGSHRRARRGPLSSAATCAVSSALNGTTAVAPRQRQGPAPSGRAPARADGAIAATTRSGSAPARSILLTKISVGTWSRRSARKRSGVWGWTPSTAETTRTAPSRTPRTRSTSAMKSGWPACRRG